MQEPIRYTELLSVPQVMTRLGGIISTASWHRLVRRGEAPQPVRIGRRTFWRAQDVASFLDGKYSKK